MSRKKRQECLRVLIRLVGPDALPEFLRARQPEMGDRTGQHLLDNEPAALLKRLRVLERQRSGEEAG